MPSSNAAMSGARASALGSRAALGQRSRDRQQDDQRARRGIATKNAYRHAFRKQRCIIPADGFFDWKVVEGQKRKQPMYIHRVDGEPLAFARFVETWRGPERNDEPLYTCTIIHDHRERDDGIGAQPDAGDIARPTDGSNGSTPEVQDTDELAKLLLSRRRRRCSRCIRSARL
jgi:hypothetical protein